MKPDYNAILAWHKLCREYMITEYERIARESGNQETLKVVLAVKARRARKEAVNDKN